MTTTELIALVTAIIAIIAAGIALQQASSAKISARSSIVSAEAAVKSADAIERQATLMQGQLSVMQEQLRIQEQDRSAGRRPKVQLLVQPIEHPDGRFIGKYLKLRNAGAEMVNIISVLYDGLGTPKMYLQIKFGPEDPREQIVPGASSVIAWSLPTGMSFNSGGLLPLRSDAVHQVTVVVRQHGSPDQVELTAQVRVDLDGSMSIEDQATRAVT